MFICPMGIFGISIISVLLGVLGTGYLLYLPKDNLKMQKVAGLIKDGISVYLKQKYLNILPILFLMSGIILSLYGVLPLIYFLLGVTFSILVINIGIWVACMANLRTAYAAQSSFFASFNTAFNSGSVIALIIIGLSLLLMISIYKFRMQILFQEIIFFFLGISLSSLFTRLGGGIFTKSADIGADLVGKIENALQEDDPRNPASIADNVGDIIGDCGSAIADIFETYMVVILSSMLFIEGGNLYVLRIAAVIHLSFILSLFLRYFFICKNIQRHMSIMIVFHVLLSTFFLKTILDQNELFLCAILGLISTIFCVFISAYYTGNIFRPVQSIKDASVQGGAAINIIQGLAISFESVVPAILIMLGGFLLSYTIAEYVGIGIFISTILSFISYIMVFDSYGPISDTSGGIVAMARDTGARKNTDRLDIIGNATKAITKGYITTASALICVLMFVANLSRLNIEQVKILPLILGLFFGAIIIYIFVSLILYGVNKLAMQVASIVRMKISKEISEDHSDVINLLANSAFKQISYYICGVLIMPIFIYNVFVYDNEAVMIGYLLGVLVTGTLMSISMVIAGGAWDNAKKNLEGESSAAHSAAIIGDTVGDPYKDAAGPAITSIMKMTTLICLILFA